MNFHVCSPGFYLRKVMDRDVFQSQTLTGVFTWPKQSVLKLVDCFDKRFEYVSTDVLAATQIAYLPSWPAELQDGALSCKIIYLL